MDPNELIKAAPAIAKGAAEIIAAVPLADIVKRICGPPADLLGDKLRERVERCFEKTAHMTQEAGFTPLASEVVRPMRAKECAVHLEARVTQMHRIHGAKLEELGGGWAAEVEVLRVHVAEEYVAGERYIDPVKWSPLIYNFRHYFRLADKELGKTFRAEK